VVVVSSLRDIPTLDDSQYYYHCVWREMMKTSKYREPEPCHRCKQVRVLIHRKGGIKLCRSCYNNSYMYPEGKVRNRLPCPHSSLKSKCKICRATYVRERRREKTGCSPRKVVLPFVGVSPCPHGIRYWSHCLECTRNSSSWRTKKYRLKKK
jgi:hypothetical protein